MKFLAKAYISDGATKNAEVRPFASDFFAASWGEAEKICRRFGWKLMGVASK